MADQIIISQLEVSSFIGATEDERRDAQTLRVSLALELEGGFEGLGDRLEGTVDYAAVAEKVRALAAGGERVLVETLAVDVVEMLLEEYPLAAVEVEVRKFVLPGTEYVAARVRRAR